MGAHTHNAGEWMVSYRTMVMDMQMRGIMYSPTDDLTLMGMTNYTRKSMKHVRRDGVKFKTIAKGMGDTSLTALYKIKDTANQQFHLHAGFSLPTGSIGVKDNLPAPVGRSRLPYPHAIGFRHI